MTTVKEFIIPRVTPQQIVLIGARTAGIIATGIAQDSRKFAPDNNPYDGQVVSYQKYANQQDAPLKDSHGNPLSNDFGLPVWVQVTFGSVTYTDVNGNTIVTPRLSFESILVSVSFPRNIVKTEIQGRNGTVKEYIGEGDAQISFRGVMTGGNGHYPGEQVAQLMEVIKAPCAIPVISRHLGYMGIQSVVFEDRSFEQEEGSYSYQVFSLNAISDTPQELRIAGM
jgi:hypothetical protein